MTDRQTIMETAIEFLQKVPSNKNFQEVRKFLVKKGLSDSEITAAIEKSGILNKISVSPESMINLASPPLPQLPPAHITKWENIRHFFNVLVIVGGSTYALHYIYKKFIEPAITGRKRKTAEESIVEIQQSVVAVLQQIQVTMASLERTVQRQTDQLEALKKCDNTTNQDKLIKELKTEMVSCKSLLLNRSSFAPAPKIPAWQRSSNDSNENKSEPLNNSSSEKNDKQETSTSPEILMNGHKEASSQSDLTINGHIENKTDSTSEKKSPIENGDLKINGHSKVNELDESLSDSPTDNSSEC